jgi:putative hemolysin
MSEPKTCATCKTDLTGVERWDCSCGCGKSWCAEHGRHRKRAELPGDKSYLVCVQPESEKAK